MQSLFTWRSCCCLIRILTLPNLEVSLRQDHHLGQVLDDSQILHLVPAHGVNVWSACSTKKCTARRVAVLTKRHMRPCWAFDRDVLAGVLYSRAVHCTMAHTMTVQCTRAPRTKAPPSSGGCGPCRSPPRLCRHGTGSRPGRICWLPRPRRHRLQHAPASTVACHRLNY